MTPRGWTLDKALTSWSCPICVLVRQDTFNFLARQLFAWSTDDRAGLDLVAEGGFCAHHAAEAMHLASGVGVASIYDRFLRAALGLLDDWKRQSEPPAASAPASPLLQPRCPVCLARRESEAHHSEALVNRLEDQRHRKGYELSRGLCLPHLKRAMEKAKDAEVRSFLLEAQVAQVERLRDDLASSKRKREARPQQEMTPRERTAWMTVVEKFAGRPC